MSKSTARAWLFSTTALLKKSGVGTARLDALVLLSDALGWDQAKALAETDFELSRGVQSKLKRQIKRRVSHEPLAYIRGKSEFWGRDFLVNKSVLQPRPESETMIELLLGLPTKHQILADVGTGNGCLAITAKLEIPDATVIATDIDPAALRIASENAKLHNVKIEFLSGDLLSPLKTINYNLTTVLANLPYVPDDFSLNEAAMNEPKIAIFGGPDGLDHYRRLFEQAVNFKSRPRYILTESLPFQHQKLEQIALKNGYRQIETSGFIQLFTPKT